MSTPDLRGLHGLPIGWRRACPWLPALLRTRRIFIGPDGTTLRVDDLGRLDVVHLGALPGHKSIAADPNATRLR